MSRSPLVILFLVAVALAAPAAALADAPAIVVDGVAVRTDVPPVVENGRVLVPLRGIFERFNADVSYDEKTATVVATRNGIDVRVTVGSTEADINGHQVDLEVAPQEVDGRIEVPLRFVAQALGVSVDYDDATNTVVVDSAAGGALPATPVVSADETSAAPAAPQLAQPAVAPSITDERPANGTLIGSQFPEIYAAFTGDTPVDPVSVRVTVDGIDVTGSSTVSSQYVEYTPAEALYGGSHSVEITGAGTAGEQFVARWSFRIDDDLSTGYLDSIIGYGPGRFGYHRFGYYPPGFSLFSPGPGYFFAGQPIIIVFFSPYFPYGSGFFTVGGIPGEFAMTPWLGCPGYFWSVLDVPYGAYSPNAIVAARFTTDDGRMVVAHATAPLRIDGTRRSFPSSLRFAVRASVAVRPKTPRSLVAFQRFAPSERPIAHAAMFDERLPGGFARAPVIERRIETPVRVIAVPAPKTPIVLPAPPIVPAPVVARPVPIEPVPVHVAKPIPPRPS